MLDANDLAALHTTRIKDRLVRCSQCTARHVRPPLAAARVGWTHAKIVGGMDLVDRHSHELRNGTIERVLAMSNVELGLYSLLSKPPRRR